MLKLLDDECLVAGGNDEAYARKLYARLESHPHLEAHAKLKVNHRFVLHHYAGAVEYNSSGFVEKNRDALFPEALELLGASSAPLVAKLFAPASAALPDGARVAEGSADGGKTASGRSKSQGAGRSSALVTQSVSAVFEVISATAPNYVRCLKPNDENVPCKVRRAPPRGRRGRVGDGCHGYTGDKVNFSSQVKHLSIKLGQSGGGCHGYT